MAHRQGGDESGHQGGEWGWRPGPRARSKASLTHVPRYLWPPEQYRAAGVSDKEPETHRNAENPTREQQSGCRLALPPGPPRGVPMREAGSCSALTHPLTHPPL